MVIEVLAAYSFISMVGSIVIGKMIAFGGSTG